MTGEEKLAVSKAVTEAHNDRITQAGVGTPTRTNLLCCHSPSDTQCTNQYTSCPRALAPRISARLAIPSIVVNEDDTQKPAPSGPVFVYLSHPIYHTSLRVMSD
jgi:hypothetical protein